MGHRAVHPMPSEARRRAHIGAGGPRWQGALVDLPPWTARHSAWARFAVRGILIDLNHRHADSVLCAAPRGSALVGPLGHATLRDCWARRLPV